MLGSVIGALSDRMDSKFLTAYWLPAFVFVFGSLCTVGLSVGRGRLEAWISDLDAVEQTLAVLMVVLMITMLAFTLRAVTRPITEIFAGMALPAFVANPLRQGQVRAKHRAALVLHEEMPTGALSAAQQENAWLLSRFPTNDQNLKPTLFGNLLASVGEHPRIAYSMEGAIWWPRLSPLLPGSFQDTLGGAQAPMMALFNLSAVFSGLAFLAVMIGLVTRQWLVAILACACSLLLARLAYRAAVSQATEVASMLRVAFDLYRFDILDQLGRAHPDDNADERALWLSLTREVMGVKEPKPGSRPEGSPAPS